jgi:hypothetical protein
MLAHACMQFLISIFCFFFEVHGLSSLQFRVAVGLYAKSREHLALFADTGKAWLEELFEIIRKFENED